MNPILFVMIKMGNGPINKNNKIDIKKVFV